MITEVITILEKNTLAMSRIRTMTKTVSCEKNNEERERERVNKRVQREFIHLAK